MITDLVVQTKKKIINSVQFFFRDCEILEAHVFDFVRGAQAATIKIFFFRGGQV
jgi:hypothetical protein